MYKKDFVQASIRQDFRMKLQQQKAFTCYKNNNNDNLRRELMGISTNIKSMPQGAQIPLRIQTEIQF